MKHRPAVQEMDVRTTALGSALYVRVYTPNHRVLGYAELRAVLVDAYPGYWAVQSIPLDDRHMDEQHIYHYLLFEDAPQGFDLFSHRR